MKICREVADSKCLAELCKLPRHILETVVGDGHALVVTIEKIKAFGSQVELQMFSQE